MKSILGEDCGAAARGTHSLFAIQHCIFSPVVAAKPVGIWETGPEEPEEAKSTVWGMQGITDRGRES